MRLIDADKLLEEIKRIHTQEYYDPRYDFGFNACLTLTQACVCEAPTIAPPPNEPLTVEELREIDGEPVWVEVIEPTLGKNSGWALVYNDGSRHTVQRWTAPLWCSEYGETWIAYRRKRGNKENESDV